MSLYSDMRTKEEVLKSDYITVMELGLFKDKEDFRRQQEEFDRNKDELINSRFEILDLR